METKHLLSGPLDADTIKKALLQLPNEGFLSLKRTKLRFSLDYGEVSLYEDWQRRMAALIPCEYDRPVVELCVTNKTVAHTHSAHTHSSAKTRFAIVGGMGPLSDAILLRETINILSPLSLDKSKNNPFRACDVYLLSIAPPRTLLQWFRGGLQFLFSLFLFLSISASYAKVFLASNTAHVNIGVFRLLSRSPVADLTAQVAQNTCRRAYDNAQHKTHNTNRDPKVLIMGTLMGHKSQLYERQFDAMGLAYATLLAAEQRSVQTIIDATKAGNGNCDDKIADTLFDHINRGIERNNANIVLLGCTELPIALGETRIKCLEADGIAVVNTETEFARCISDEIIKIRMLR